MEFLSQLSLPSGFPTDLIPPKVTTYIQSLHQGMTEGELRTAAASLGMSVFWEQLPAVGENCFALGLNCDGVLVPLMACMDFKPSFH